MTSAATATTQYVVASADVIVTVIANKVVAVPLVLALVSSCLRCHCHCPSKNDNSASAEMVRSGKFVSLMTFR